MLGAAIFTNESLYAMDPPVEDKKNTLLSTKSTTEKIEKINEINEVGQPKGVGNFHSLETFLTLENWQLKPSSYSRDVPQHYVGYSNDQYPLIGSVGAGPCVIMVAYNPDPAIRTAAVCHVDEGTDLSSLDIIFDTLETNHHSNLDVHLAGGDTSNSSIDMIYEIIQKIEMRKNLVIKSADLLDSKYVTSRYTDYGKQLAIDARTGLVYTHFKQFNRSSSIDDSWFFEKTSPLRIEKKLTPELAFQRKDSLNNSLSQPVIVNVGGAKKPQENFNLITLFSEK